MNAQGDSSNMEFQWKYDVFLSFRGEDTRKNFTDHLHTALHQKGIVTYRDDPSLEKGHNISNEVLKAIENSKYLVVIMSRNYASSTWCLEELAKIVECMTREQQIAIPIFYKVDPSNVRKQTGSFQSAFAKHEATFKDDMNKVQKWKNAMKEIAGLAGWDLLDRPESLFIQDIIKDLQNKLGRRYFYAPKNLVGMESRLEDMFLHLSLGSNDVRFIGISGMGGIGKSTLARVVFNEINAQFEGCSFLANIREVSETLGLVDIQNKLLFDVLREKDLVRDVIAGASVIEERLQHKRVLVVLDDVDQVDQLEYLAKKSWFGHGSRVIITTRDEHVLLTHHVDVVYKAKELSNKEALELFCLKAFKENHHRKEFETFTKQVVQHVRGLPLALTVLGSFLHGRSMIQWKSALAKLQKSPNKLIFETLRLSFDKLDKIEKEIFLDIACFFNGYNKDYVMEILKSCDFHPEIGVEVLTERSLVTITENKFMVHDLLRKMAWEIVKEESPQDPGKRSRLWLYDDIKHVLESSTGTGKIEAIVINYTRQITINADSFSKMTNLRLLVLPRASELFEIKVLSNNFKSLSNKLRYLASHRYPSKYLPASFLPEGLYALKLRGSNLRRLWRSQKIFEKLKQIDLRGSKYLEETPDFTTTPNLEKLILASCYKLSRIHPSLGFLHNLKVLDLKYCKNLRKLPLSIGGLRSLEVLCLEYCTNLVKLPDSICNLERLEELDITNTAIAYLPQTFRNMNNLRKLYYSRYRRMERGLRLVLFLKARNAMGMFLPSLSGFSSLEELYIGNWPLQGGIPNDLGCLSSLKELILSSSNFLTIPESINQILHLKSLKLSDCENLQTLPTLPESILYVEVKKCMKLKSISNLFTIFNCVTKRCLINSLKFLPEDVEVPSVQKYPLALLCYIIGCSEFPDRFELAYVVGPNIEIPEWFTYQNDGSSLSFCMRNPYWFKHEVSGFVLCASFQRQEQEYSDRKHPEDCYDILICEFNISGHDQLRPLICFPIRFVTSGFLWMGFVPLRLFPDHAEWEQIVNERIDVSMMTLDDQSKVIKCGILPLQEQNPRTCEKYFFQSACISSEDLTGVFHKLVYQEVDYHFPRSSDNEERSEYYRQLREVSHGHGASIEFAGSYAVSNRCNRFKLNLRNGLDTYDLWCKNFKQD